jgi:integrase
MDCGPGYLRWEQIDFNGAVLHVRRIKNGSPFTHPLTGRELHALRQHQRESNQCFRLLVALGCVLSLGFEPRRVGKRGGVFSFGLG